MSIVQSAIDSKIGIRPRMEAYPAYTDHALTVRVDRGNKEPAMWVDLTLAEAKDFLLDLEEVIALVRAEEPRGEHTYSPTTWTVRSWLEGDDPDKVEKYAVANNKSDVVVWFDQFVNATAIAERLNKR